MKIKIDTGRFLEVTDSDIEIVKTLANNFRFFRAEVSASKTTDVMFFAEKDFNTKKAQDYVDYTNVDWDHEYLWEDDYVSVDFLYEESSFGGDIGVELTKNAEELLDSLSYEVRRDFALLGHRPSLVSIQNMIYFFKNNELICVSEDPNQTELNFEEGTK